MGRFRPLIHQDTALTRFAALFLQQTHAAKQPGGGCMLRSAHRQPAIWHRLSRWVFRPATANLQPVGSQSSRSRHWSATAVANCKPPPPGRDHRRPATPLPVRRTQPRSPRAVCFSQRHPSLSSTNSSQRDARRARASAPSKPPRAPGKTNPWSSATCFPRYDQSARAFVAAPAQADRARSNQ